MNSDMEDAYAADPEPTVYTKQNEVRYEDLSDDGTDDKHVENKREHMNNLCKKLHSKMKFY
jgi:hypothetical protein